MRNTGRKLEAYGTLSVVCGMLVPAFVQNPIGIGAGLLLFFGGLFVFVVGRFL